MVRFDCGLCGQFDIKFGHFNVSISFMPPTHAYAMYQKIKMSLFQPDADGCLRSNAVPDPRLQARRPGGLPRKEWGAGRPRGTFCSTPGSGASFGLSGKFEHFSFYFLVFLTVSLTCFFSLKLHASLFFFSSSHSIRAAPSDVPYFVPTPTGKLIGAYDFRL